MDRYAASGVQFDGIFAWYGVGTSGIHNSWRTFAPWVCIAFFFFLVQNHQHQQQHREAAGVDHQKYWSEVPAHVAPKLRFYNTPVQEDVMAPGQPLNILYQVYKPGDFVVFKLDIDQVC